MNTSESDDRNIGFFGNRINILPTRYAVEKINKIVILSAICLVGAFFVTVGLFFTSESPENRTMAAVQASQKPTTTAKTSPNNEADKTELPALNGEKAITHLKKSGMYSSLGEAVTAARYRAERINERVVASNHANELHAEFDETGLKLSSTSQDSKWLSRWRLESVGYGDQQTAIKSGELSSQGQRVEIRREEQKLIEWFENRPRGLEHGFTLSERPQTKQSLTGSLRLVMEVGGDLRPEANKNGNELILTDGKGKEVIRYKKLKVWDADKNEQTARMEVSDNKVFLEVEEANAKYPLTIDPTFETAKLLPSDGAAHDHYGGSVSISGDTAIVGSRFDQDNGFSPGSAYIFVRDAGGAWTEQAKLRASDGEHSDRFGESVSIDGDSVIVGTSSEFHAGSGYIFVRAAGVWSEQAKLTASDRAANDQIGVPVSMVSISGNTAILGVHGDDDIGGLDSGNVHTNSGSAYIFVRNGTSWTEQAKLRASDGAAGDEFGLSVSISGETVIVGASGDEGTLGAAYIFVREAGGFWTEKTKLTASDGAVGDFFGFSVSISGGTAVVGADGPSNHGFGSGTAYIFVRNGTIWTEQARLMASDGVAGDQFGQSVSIDGDKVIVGALLGSGNVFASGTAYTFVRDGNGVWTEEAKLAACDGEFFDFFGASVSISGDTKIVGAWADDDNGESSGSAYIFPLFAINSPPVANAEMDQTVEPTGPGGALVTLDGSLSSDPEGDTLTYSWNGPFGTASGVMPDVTIPLGTHVITLTVDDGNCHTSTDTVTVAVLYNFSEFLEPIDNDEVNLAKAGGAIPIKFSLNGDKGLDILAPGYPFSIQIPCLDEAVDDEEVPTVTAGNSSLSYDPVKDQYNYVWKTSKDWKGTCRRLVVKLNDGSIHTADFQFK